MCKILVEELEKWYFFMPDQFKSSSRADEIQYAIAELEEAIDDLTTIETGDKLTLNYNFNYYILDYPSSTYMSKTKRLEQVMTPIVELITFKPEELEENTDANNLLNDIENVIEKLQNITFPSINN